MSTRLPDVLSSRDLPLTELSSLCLDGEVFRVGDSWSPVDLVEDRDQRARSVALLVPVRAIAERLTAAWIYGLAPEPERHQFCVPITARAYFPPSPRFGVREVVCAPGSAIRVGSLLVTRPLRTALDLARWPPPELPAPAPLIANLLRLAGYRDTAAARSICATDSLPYTHRALVQLRAADGEMQARTPTGVDLLRGTW